MGIWTIQGGNYKNVIPLEIEGDTLEEAIENNIISISKNLSLHKNGWKISVIEMEWRYDILNNNGGTEITFHTRRKSSSDEETYEQAYHICWVPSVPADLPHKVTINIIQKRSQS